MSDALWNRLGADPSIVGRDVRLNGQPHTVIGVMPASFAFVRHANVGAAQRADAFTLRDINLAEANPNAGVYAGPIRARRGTPPAHVAAAVEAVGKTVDARDFKSRGLKLYPTGLKPDLVAGIRPTLLTLGAAGGFLLLVLMMNLASVLPARAAERTHEFAVSRALGASGAAVVRTTLVEGGALGLVGGISATLVAIWGTHTVLALAPLDLPRHERVAIDWTIAVAVVCLGVLLGLLAAIAPAMWAVRLSLSPLLATSTVRGGSPHGRKRQAMVVIQVTLSLILLNAGGLVIRSFEFALRADPGFTPNGILTVRVPMPVQLIPATGDVLMLQQRVEQAFAAIPGVTGVSATSALPLTASAGQLRVRIPGAPGNTGDAARDAPLVDVIATRAAYVEIMGLRLLEGRAFDRVRHDGVAEALIDRALAKQFFPTGSPVGAKIPFEKQALTIVGVVKQARQYDLHRDGRPQLFVRAEDWRFRTLTFVLRTAHAPQSMIPDVRSSMRGIDGRLALAELRTMDQVVADALRQQRASAVLIAGFAIGALVLVAKGLFGVISGSITRRRHELAVRLAIGADHRGLLRLILKDGAALIVIGIVVGAPGIHLIRGLMQGILVGVSPLDPLALSAAALGLGFVAVVACYVPARRVLAIAPAQSLRAD